jgi:hypothetical protein
MSITRYSVALLLLLFGLATGETDRQIDRSTSVETYRARGDTRSWSYTLGGERFGQLQSQSLGSVNYGGRQVVVFRSTLNLDNDAIGGTGKLQEQREHLVTAAGDYVGGRIITARGESVDTVTVRRKGTTIQSLFKRGERQVTQSLEVPPGTPVWDQYFVDQLELILAMRDLTVGTEFVDSVFEPSAMIMSRLTGRVDDFFYQEIYRGSFDSVFFIQLSEPLKADLYFTPDKRLVRIDFINLKYRIYQDLVKRGTASPVPPVAEPPIVKERGLPVVISHFALYLLFAVVAVALFMKSGYRWAQSYLAAGFGVGLFLITIVTQIPLQKAIIEQWLVPSVSAGGSLYGWGLLPPLIAGLFQESLKLAGILILVRWKKPRDYRVPILGAFAGGGFGLAEACYRVINVVIPVFTLALLESGFMIAFHVCSAVLLGRAVTRSSDTIIRTLLLLILFNALLRYLPVFVQQDVATAGVMYFVLAFLVLVLLAYTLFRLSGLTETKKA